MKLVSTGKNRNPAFLFPALIGTESSSFLKPSGHRSAIDFIKVTGNRGIRSTAQLLPFKKLIRFLMTVCPLNHHCMGGGKMNKKRKCFWNQGLKNTDTSH